mmetsp:Transcript_13984/g.21332  ORF Transcript_13984/g.21332 Transcript_13984/m.21332 type:complete len:88 (-) Transcript_13984:1174-1437(-)
MAACSGESGLEKIGIILFVALSSSMSSLPVAESSLFDLSERPDDLRFGKNFLILELPSTVEVSAEGEVLPLFIEPWNDPWNDPWNEP